MTQFRPLTPGNKRIVLMGCGGVGASVARQLADQGHAVHVLDLDTRSFDHLPQGHISDEHIVPLVADGTFEDGLTRAGIGDADVFIAVAGRDVVNILAAQLARHLFAVPLTICRVDDPARQQMYNDLGLVAVSATSLVTDMVVNAATR